MQQISFANLMEWEQAQIDFVLIDVREDFEHEHFNIGGLHIPLGELTQNIHQIPKDKPLVIYCAKGIRSVIALQKLATKGYTKLYNLEGGIKSMYPS